MGYGKPLRNAATNVLKLYAKSLGLPEYRFKIVEFEDLDPPRYLQCVAWKIRCVGAAVLSLSFRGFGPIICIRPPLVLSMPVREVLPFTSLTVTNIPVETTMLLASTPMPLLPWPAIKTFNSYRTPQ